MTGASAAPTFPRRDDHGRVISLGQLVAGAVGGTLLALLGVALIDGLFAVIGLGTFDTASGWLALILPALLFFDDLRAWRGRSARPGARVVVAVVSGLVAVGLGLVVAALASSLPSILSGGVGALVAVLVYSPMWFVGVRRLAGPQREAESR